MDTGRKRRTQKMRLVLKGKPSYLNYMFNHLKKEHPSTRKRLTKVTK